MENREELIYLLARYRKRACSQDEVVRLLSIIKSSCDEDFRELFESENEREEIIHAADVSAEKRARMEGIFRQIERKRKSAETTLRLRRVLPYAAAVIILVVGYWLYNTLNPYVKHKSTETELVSRFGDDVLPGSNRAILSLSDGREIALSEEKLGIRSGENGLAYMDGSSIGETAGAKEIIVKTPRAGQYFLILPDSTKVWLNAASSITYPSRFSGNLREVTITGEAYLEITRNTSMPFVVWSSRQKIQVLGTTINVNDYSDEPSGVTTLISGSVQVTDLKAGKMGILKPGQQAASNNQGMKITSIPPDRMPGWKDGLLVLHNVRFAQIRRELERWYDIEFVGQPQSSTTITAILSRRANLSEVLEAMEDYTGLTFKIEGRRIMVQ